jgi:hypothetical protein
MAPNKPIITNRVWNLYKSFLSSCFKTKESWLWIPWQQCVGCCIRVYMSENVEKSLLLLLPTCVQSMLPMLSLHPAFFEDAPSVLTTKHRTGKTCSPFSLVRSKKIWNMFPNHNLLLQELVLHMLETSNFILFALDTIYYCKESWPAQLNK